MDLLEDIIAKPAQEYADLSEKQSSVSKLQKKNYSQYDQVKLKVSLENHFYVFSRFLMSRILTLIKIRERDAIKITLDIKKELVEQLRIEVTQQELEEVLFRKIEEF